MDSSPAALVGKIWLDKVQGFAVLQRVKVTVTHRIPTKEFDMFWSYFEIRFHEFIEPKTSFSEIEEENMCVQSSLLADHLEQQKNNIKTVLDKIYVSKQNPQALVLLYLMTCSVTLFFNLHAEKEIVRTLHTLITVQGKGERGKTTTGPSTTNESTAFVMCDDVVGESSKTAVAWRICEEKPLLKKFVKEKWGELTLFKKAVPCWMQ